MIIKRKTLAALSCAVCAGLLYQVDGQVMPPKDCPAVMPACVPHVRTKADLPAETTDTRPAYEASFTATASTSGSTINDVFGGLWDDGPLRLRFK